MTVKHEAMKKTRRFFMFYVFMFHVFTSSCFTGLRIATNRRYTRFCRARQRITTPGRLTDPRRARRSGQSPQYCYSLAKEHSSINTGVMRQRRTVGALGSELEGDAVHFYTARSGAERSATPDASVKPTDVYGAMDGCVADIFRRQSWGVCCQL